MGWQKIIFTRDQIIAGEQKRMMLEFAELCRRAGRPKDAALFGSLFPDEKGNVEEYFSPAGARIAAELIRQHGGGTPCLKPSAESVSLSHGSQSAWSLLKS